MTGSKKIFLGIVFALLATMIIGIRYMLPENYVVPSASCSVCKIVFSKNNGSVPPAYRRDYVFTAYDSGQKINADYEISSGYGGSGNMAKKILGEGPINLSADEFKNLVARALLVRPTLTSGEDSVAGCTGGSGQSLTIYDKDAHVFEVKNYSCAGHESNKSLGVFSASMEKYFP